MGFSVDIETVAVCSTRPALVYLRDIYIENREWKDEIFELRPRFIKLARGHLINLFDFGLIFDYDHCKKDQFYLEDWDPQKLEDLFNTDYDLEYDYDEFSDQLGYFALEGLLALELENKDISQYLLEFEGIEDIRINSEQTEIFLNYTSSYKGSEDLDIDYLDIAKQIMTLKQHISEVKIVTRVNLD